MKTKHGKLIFEYNKITNYIYIGTNLCCQDHFKKHLLKKGVVADISLEKEKLDNPEGVNYFLWLPVKDHTAPTQEQLKVGVCVINELINAKKKIYVHCQYGHGRSPTLVAAYLISTGKKVKEAIQLIKKKRSTIHLDDVQVKALEKFATNL